MKRVICLLVYPVKDLSKSKTLFTKYLGVDPYVESTYYVGYKLGELEIGLDPNGQHNGMTGPIAYMLVDDIKSELRSLLGAGAKDIREVSDVGGGRFVATVRDPDGNVIGLRQDP